MPVESVVARASPGKSQVFHWYWDGCFRSARSVNTVKLFTVSRTSLCHVVRLLISRGGGSVGVVAWRRGEGSRIRASWEGFYFPLIDIL